MFAGTRMGCGLVLGSLLLFGCGGSGGGDCDPIAATLVSRIEVAPGTATVVDGESLQLAATAFSCDGSQLALSSIAWNSADVTTVTVSGSGVAQALRTGGPVVVSASGQGIEGHARITVTPRAVASVRVEPATATVAVGRSSTLVAKAFDVRGAELPGRTATWISANGAIATVSPLGAVTGVAAGGPVPVTATIEGQSGAAQVTVVEAAVASVTVSPPSSTIITGTTVLLSAVLQDDLGNVLTGRVITWSTSDGVRASVSNTGLVTGLAPGGSITIFANSEGRSGSALVTVNPPPLVITTNTLPTGTAGLAYSQALAATGGTTPYGWTVAAGTLPAGLTLGSAGVLGGTPTTAGTSSFTVRVTDAAARTATQALTLVVNPPPLVVTTTTLPAGTAATAYSQALTASGGTPPYGWTVAAGTLPEGLTLSGAGALSGTPTTGGTSTFTVRVTDAASRIATQALTLVVNPPPLVITTTTLPAGTAGTAYSQALAAIGGTPPYSWTVAAGTLPEGLTLGSAGVLSGTPTTAGTSNFTVQVTDVASRTTTQALALETAAATALVAVQLGGFTVVDASPGVGTIAGAGFNCGASGGTCSQSVPLGTVLTLTATPDPNNFFLWWDAPGCTKSTARECVTTVAGAMTVTAYFALRGYLVSVTVEGADADGVVDGLIVPGGGDLNCQLVAGVQSGRCAVDQPYGDRQTGLQAHAFPGSVFVGWSGDCTGTNCVLAPNPGGGYAVTATFARE